MYKKLRTFTFIIQINFTISEKGGTLIPELNRKILKTAAIYEKQNMDKDFKPYITSDPTN